MTEASITPRRRRFQFSLLTLMIVVIMYGLLWLLTIKWGANQLAWAKTKDDEHHGGLGLGEPTLTGDGIVQYTESISVGNKPEMTTSPAPFILTWHSDVLIDETTETYFWFFGKSYILERKTRPAHW